MTLKTANGSKLVIQYVKELAQGKQTEDVLEGMMCEGGCMGGVDSQISNLILSKNHAKAENEKVKDVKITSIKKRIVNLKNRWKEVCVASVHLFFLCFFLMPLFFPHLLIERTGLYKLFICSDLNHLSFFKDCDFVA